MYPILFRFGWLAVPTYGAVLALGLLAALRLSQHTARLANVDGERLWNLEVATLFAGIVARQGLLLAGLSEWAASVAAILLASLVAVLLLRGSRLLQLATLDALAPPAAVALAARELACLMTGANYGVPTDHAWGIVFNSRRAWRMNGTTMGVPLEPVQIESALVQLLLAVTLLAWLRRKHCDGEAAGAWLLATGFCAAMIEQWRAPATLWWLPGDWLSATQPAYAAMIVLGGCLLWRRRGVCA